MSLFPIRLLTFALLAAAATARTEEISATGVLLDRVAAVVNDGIVLQSDLDQQAQLISSRIQQQGQQPPPRDVLRQQVLERLVLQELQLQRAERLGIQITDEMLNTALTDVAERNKIAFSDLPAALEQQGVDYRGYRDEMRKEMTMTALRQRDVYSRIYVSPRELDQCVVKRKGSPAETQEYNLAHILVAVPESATSEQVAERAARAEGVYERARSGEDFAQLAIAYSDAGTALEGGSLGWRNTGQLPSFVAEIIPRCRPGRSRSRSARRAVCISSSSSRCVAPNRRRSCRRFMRGTSSSRPTRSRTTRPCARSSRRSASGSSAAKTSRRSPR